MQTRGEITWEMSQVIWLRLCLSAYALICAIPMVGGSLVLPRFLLK